MQIVHTTEIQELNALCAAIREYAQRGDLEKGEQLATEAMGKYPDAPQPHNLYGVLLEKKGDHCSAMKHFRAADALDPSYRPARQNLESFGTFFSHGRLAFDESDCPQELSCDYVVVRDARGIGHVVRKGLR